jgi:hypothetical protein
MLVEDVANRRERRVNQLGVFAQRLVGGVMLEYEGFRASLDCRSGRDTAVPANSGSGGGGLGTGIVRQQPGFIWSHHASSAAHSDCMSCNSS